MVLNVAILLSLPFFLLWFVSLLLLCLAVAQIALNCLLLSCTSFLVDSLRRLCKSSCATNMPPKIVLEQTDPNSITVEAYFAHRWNGLSLTSLACWLLCLLRSWSNNHSQMEQTAQSLEWPARFKKSFSCFNNWQSVLCCGIEYITCMASP